MATTNRLAWMIGGPQGSGVDSSARMFALACAHGGLNVFGKREYYSNIKGEHSYFQIRVDERTIRSSVDQVEVLGTFEPETLLRHIYDNGVKKGGAVIYDPKDLEVSLDKLSTVEENLMEDIQESLTQAGKEHVVGSVVEDAEANGIKLMAVPYHDILEEIGGEVGIKEFGRLQIIKNTVCVGASFGALNYDLDRVLETVAEIFSSKSERVIKMNQLAIEKGYKHVQENYGAIEVNLKAKGRPETKRLFIQGTVASGMGKLAAGCRLQTYYPITPATDESEFLESHAEARCVVMQAEDEIAAIGMATGAALTGARASTSTSGPGFNLMVEVFGWAGINEVPIVLVNYQRGGPSTGLPTRHEQGDLKFALNSGHGDIPRFVMAPGDLEESFWMMIDAFNWADKYQTPVVYMSDKNLANNSALVDRFPYKEGEIDRGFLVGPDDVEKYVVQRPGGPAFERFRFTDDGISPRSVLGQEHGIHWTTGDEHTPVGHISEDPTNRVRMMDKRMGKMDVALKQIPPDKKVSLYGPKDADITVVSWGSNKGAILDAMDELAEEDGFPSVNFLHIKLLAPFPADEVGQALDMAKTTVLVEQNYAAQLGGAIRQATGIETMHQVLKYQGRPMTQDEITRSLRKIAKAEGPIKEVLTHGV